MHDDDAVDRDPIKILTVCTHNRTRSVMSMAMMQSQLDSRLGSGRAIVRSLGFGPEGIAAIDDAIDAMRRRGLDVSGHRSRKVTGPRVDLADLIVTAEKDHVVRIAGESPAAFARTFTLPEFCGLVELAPAGDDGSVRDWVTTLSRGRRAADYLRSDIPEVADPTGSPARQFEAATEGIEALCTQAVSAIVRASAR